MVSIALVCWLLWQLFLPIRHDADIVLTVESGESVTSILQKMHDLELIRHRLLARQFLIFTGRDRDLESGRFVFPASHSPFYYLTHFNTTQDLITVTIPEGFTLEKIASLFNDAGLVSNNDFLAYVQYQAKIDFQDQYHFLKQNPHPSLEGYLFPETYAFSVGSSLQMMIAAMLEEFDQQIVSIWSAAPSPPGSMKARFSFHDVVTFASIVERESASIDEMPLVASVFDNRLRRRMRLESDPTVLYALGETDKARVLFRDLKVDSPYNTYRYSGLPPGPIASPSLAAFKASLAPEKTPYLFFVVNPDTGTHSFAKTYREHLKNVDYFRKNR